MILWIRTTSDSRFNDTCAQATAAPVRLGRKVLDEDPDDYYYYYSE